MHTGNCTKMHHKNTALIALGVAYAPEDCPGPDKVCWLHKALSNSKRGIAEAE